MNNSVTATGMAVKASTSGSLVIGTEGLTATSTKISADLGSSIKSLKPVTYVKADNTQIGSTNYNAGWYVPTDGKNVNVYGSPDTALTTATLTSGTNYVDYIVYLGSAGEKITNQTISATLTAPVNNNDWAAKAYTIAFYVGSYNDGVTIDASSKPAALINVKDGAAAVTLATKQTIPSVVGIETGNEVGVKITMRVFVDGALATSDTKVTETKITYEQCNSGSKYAAGTIYYTDNTGKQTVNTTSFEDGVTDVSAYYIQKSTQTDVSYKTAYVNSANVPVDATTLAVNFAIADTQ